MLNQAERHNVLKIIRRYCVLGFFPAQADLHRWELLPLTNKIKTWASHCSFLLSVLHALVNLITLARVAFLETETPVHETVIHALWAAAAPVYLFWYYWFYLKNLDAFGTFVKMTLTGNVGGERGANDQRKRSWSRRLKECTPQDWVAMLLPYMITSGACSFMIVFICYPSLKVSLYSALPESYQTPVTFSILLMEELRFLVVTVSIMTPTWILQIISIDLVNDKIQQLIRSTQRAGNSRQRFDHTYRELRHSQLYVGIVNQVNSYVIYTWKALCIFLCVGGGYAAIAHFTDYPVFGVLYYIIAVVCAFVYTFSFDQAFKIPSLFEEAAKETLYHARIGNSESVKILKLQIKSIPRVGIQVGGFHMMERESTPVFLDFVAGQIVSLLVANRPGN